MNTVYEFVFTNSDIRDKFNGKLVMKWTTLKSGKILAETITEFKSYIQKEYNTEFITYLQYSYAFKVKTDFNRFYYHLDYLFGIKNDLPF